MNPMRTGELDAVVDEGLGKWFDEALQHGMEPIALESGLFPHLGAMGWRRVVIPAGRFPHLKRDYACIDYGGWPLYTAASLPDQMAYDVCAAFAAREAEIQWEAGAYTDVLQVGRETEATPIDVPLHPGAERWYREGARGR